MGAKYLHPPWQTQLCLSMITDLIKLRLFVDKWATLITINLLSLQKWVALKVQVERVSALQISQMKETYLRGVPCQCVNAG